MFDTMLRIFACRFFISFSFSGHSSCPQCFLADQVEEVTNNNSDFHGDKGPECAVAARSEGMVESWINCSSD